MTTVTSPSKAPNGPAAAQRRAALANAHAAWFATPNKATANIALHSALVAANYIESVDQITTRLDGTTIEILVDADDFVEVIALDAYGNTLKGTL